MNKTERTNLLFRIRRATALPRTRRAAYAATAIALLLLLAAAAIYRHSQSQLNKQQQLTNKVDSLLALSTSSCRQNPINAYQQIEMAKALLAQNNNPTLLGKIHMTEASLDKEDYQYQKAIACYKKAIDEFEKANEMIDLADAYYRLGDCYKKVGIFDLGFKTTVKALNIYSSENNLKGKRRCYNNIGSFYKYLGEFDKALIFYQKALAISHELNNSEAISSALNNIGTIYSETGKNALALEFYNKSYANRKHKRSINSAIYYGNVGGVLLAMGKNTESFAALKKAQYYYSLDFDPRHKATNEMDLGDYYLATDRIDSAISFYQNALQLAKAYRLEERILSCYGKLTNAYQKANNLPKAFDSQARYLNLREKLLNSRKSLEIARLEMDFEASKDRLNRDSARLKLLLISIIFILTCLSFALTVFYIRHKHKSIVKEHILIQHNLEEEKSKVETDLNEKNRELAIYSLQMVQQQETNEAIIRKFESRFNGYSSEVRREVSSIIQDLERESASKTIWEEFEHRFIAVNPEFYQKVLQLFPDLTQNERRLCAFLKLNLSTKEISSITGQTPHSINVARTRLRKKIGLANSEANISDFLSNL